MSFWKNMFCRRDQPAACAPSSEVARLQAQGPAEQAAASDSLEYWVAKGVALRQQGKPVEALACFERLIQLQPNNVSFRHDCGTYLRELGRDSEALACYEEVVRLDPSLTIAWYSKGVTEQNLWKNEEARRSLERFVADCNQDAPEDSWELRVLGDAFGRVTELNLGLLSLPPRQLCERVASLGSRVGFPAILTLAKMALVHSASDLESRNALMRETIMILRDYPEQIGALSLLGYSSFALESLTDVRELFSATGAYNSPEVKKVGAYFLLWSDWEAIFKRNPAGTDEENGQQILGLMMGRVSSLKGTDWTFYCDYTAFDYMRPADGERRHCLAWKIGDRARISVFAN